MPSTPNGPCGWRNHVSGHWFTDPFRMALHAVLDGRESTLAQEKAPGSFAPFVTRCPRRLSYLLFAALAIKGTTNMEMNLFSTKSAIGSEWTGAERIGG